MRVHVRKTHKTKHHKTVHHKKTTTKKKKPTGAKSGVTGNAIYTALVNDPKAMSALVSEISGALLSGGFSAEIIAAIEAVVGDSESNTAGRLLAGAVSTNAGALQLNGSSQPIIAMVFLNGSATAVACYVPTHLRATIATGLSVWVMPMNGSMNDLQVFSMRNVF